MDMDYLNLYITSNTSYGELRLPPETPRINPANGRFQKGHEPANKGKKWSEYMSKRAQRRCAKGWKNLQIYRPATRPDTPHENK